VSRHRLGFLLLGLALAGGVYLLLSAPQVPESPPLAPALPAAPPTTAAPSEPAPAPDLSDKDSLAFTPGQFPVTIVRIDQLPPGAGPGEQAAARGWNALGDGRDADAVAAFELAAAQGVTGIAFGMAAAYHRLKKPAEALLMARQAVVEQPDNAQAWKLLGVLRHDQDDPKGAVEAWEKAQAIHADPQVAEWIGVTRPDVEVNEHYLMGRTRHFIVRFEGPGDAYMANRILDILEDAYSSVGLALGQYPDQTVEAILYTREQFFDVTQTPSWAGGIFDGKVRLPVAGTEPDPEDLRRIVTHEYTHAALTLATLPAVLPTWFQEGVAMNLEGGERMPWARARAARRATPVPLEALTGSFLGLGQSDAEGAYAESYLVVHSLLDRFGPFPLADLVARLRKTPFDQAFRAVYGEAPEQTLARALGDLVRPG
jgi:tetratricopeptide (TPR) repeat protein